MKITKSQLKQIIKEEMSCDDVRSQVDQYVEDINMYSREDPNYANELNNVIRNLMADRKECFERRTMAVSYTHLTLPTIYSV